MSGRHSATRSTRFGVLPSSLIGRKTLCSLVVVLVTASASGPAPQPALADGLAGGLPSQPAITPGQSLAVPAAITGTPITRDTVTATSQAQLDAARAQAAAARAAAARVAASAAPQAVVTAPAAARSGAAIVAYAEQYVGVVRYSTGASPSAGFECDGLVQWVYGAFGVALPRGVDEQASRGVRISRGQVRDGDLIVYPGQHIGLAHVRSNRTIDIIDSPDWGRTVSERPFWGAPAFVRIP